jgi:hypothetical protein
MLNNSFLPNYYKLVNKGYASLFVKRLESAAAALYQLPISAESQILN